MFTAPVFSALCALATYGLVKECRSEGAGLAAAALVAIVPSYISRSVAGSFDNEGVAIFALVFVFFTFVKVSSCRPAAAAQMAHLLGPTLAWRLAGLYQPSCCAPMCLHLHFCTLPACTCATPHNPFAPRASLSL